MHRSSMSQGLRVLSLVLVVAVAAAATVYFSAASARADGIDAGAKALAKLDDEWARAAAAKDIERIASYYADDAIAYPPNEPAAVGRDAARKVWATMLSVPGFTISWKTTHAGMATSGDLGFTAGTYEAASQGADGKKVTASGKYVCTWRKGSDGSWKAIHDIWNADAK